MADRLFDGFMLWKMVDGHMKIVCVLMDCKYAPVLLLKIRRCQAHKEGCDSVHSSAGRVRRFNYTSLCVSCAWAAGPLQSGSVSLQAEEAESVAGLRGSGCAGVLLRPARHRR